MTGSAMLLIPCLESAVGPSICDCCLAKNCGDAPNNHVLTERGLARESPQRPSESPRVLTYSKVRGLSPYKAHKPGEALQPGANGEENTYDEFRDGRIELTPPSHEGTTTPMSHPNQNEKYQHDEQDLHLSPHSWVAPDEVDEVVRIQSGRLDQVAAAGAEYFGREGRGSRSSSRMHGTGERLRSRALSSIDAAIGTIGQDHQDGEARHRDNLPNGNEKDVHSYEYQLACLPPLDGHEYQRHHVNSADHDGGTKGAWNDDGSRLVAGDDRSVGSASTVTSGKLSIRSRALQARREGRSQTTRPDYDMARDSVEISAQTATQTFPARLKLGSEKAQVSSSEAVMVSRTSTPRPGLLLDKLPGALPSMTARRATSDAAASAAMNSASASDASQSNDRFSIRSGRPRKSRTMQAR
jgi:hypothetical protein